MRIQRLKLQAFGPFKDEVDIDFKPFYESGLLWIRGETGAGKTALLDGITFALYGKSSTGLKDDLKQVRCDHVKDDRPTIVQLDVALNAGVYRFEAQVLMKRRRSGEIVFDRTVHQIYRQTFNDSGEVYEALFAKLKQRDLQTETQRLIGLGVEQFCQVVLLPQGAFARFLMASGQDKEKILASILKLDHYDRLLEWMKASLLKREKDQDHVQARIWAECQRFHVEKLEALCDLSEAQANVVHELQDRLAHLEQAKNEAYQTYQTALGIAQRFQILADLESQWRDYMDQRPSMEKLATQLAVCERYRQVLPFRIQYDEKQKQAKALRSSLNEISHEIAVLKAKQSDLAKRVEWAKAGSDFLLQLPTYCAVLEKWQENRARWQNLQREYLSLLEVEKTCAENQNQLHQLEVEMRMTDEEKLVAMQELQTLSEKSSDCLSIEKIRDIERLWDKIRHVFEALLLKQDQLAEARQRCQAAKDQLRSREESLVLHQCQWVVDLATRLSPWLHQFEHCPFCGHDLSQKQMEEPVDASMDDLSISPTERSYIDDLQNCRTQVIQAKANVELLRREWSEQVDVFIEVLRIFEIEAERIPIGTSPDLNQIAEELRTHQKISLERLTWFEETSQWLKTESAKTSAYGAKQTALQNRIQQAQEKREQLSVPYLLLQQKQSSLHEQLGKLPFIVAEREASAHLLDEQQLKQTLLACQDETAFLKEFILDEPPDALTEVAASGEQLWAKIRLDLELEAFADTIGQLQAWLDHLKSPLAFFVERVLSTDQALSERHATFVQQQKIFIEQEEDIKTALAETDAAYQNALAEQGLDEAELTNIQSWLLDEKTMNETYHRWLQQGRYLEAEIKKLNDQLADQDRPDLEQLSLCHQAAEEKLMSVRLQLNTAQSEHAQMKNAIAQIERLEAEQLERHQETVQLTDFYKEISGDTGIGLKRFILSYVMKEVIAKANELLSGVHDGRYALKISDYRIARERKLGLSLLIEDGFTRAFRAVQTLSGGEQFLVSLALSIAFSEMIQIQMGANPIQTMFIDEGFGTLDRSSLAEAMRLIIRERKPNTLIALISHVQDLQAYIPNILRIDKQQNGSKVLPFG